MANTFFQKLAEARETLGNFKSEQIQVVLNCWNDEATIISKYYIDDGYEDIWLGDQLSECKRDYMLEALDYDLTEDMFETIYDALNVVKTHEAMAYA